MDTGVNAAAAAVAKASPVEAGRLKLRKKLLTGLVSGVVAVAAVGFAYNVLVASHYAETDNAYVGADTATITPLYGGPVAQVLVDNAQAVKQGQVLVQLDDTDAQIALAEAQANLANTRRRVEALFAVDDTLKAQIAARDADEKAAQANLAKAKIDLARRQSLLASGGVSADVITAAQTAYSNAVAGEQLARANYDSAVAAYQANHALIDGTTVDTNPQVLAAQAERDQAQVNLNRTIIRAPVDGIVTSRDVQVGQQVQPGQTLMLVVPVSQAYVDANFKEVQLAKVRPGQKVTLTSDLYGGGVTFHGTVVGFSGGTGAAFALLPAQNATGNWIKVVQRLPVRIALDPAELTKHPLRVGLSMDAVINTAK
jgi:membrane fusion protein (multidrug efflux system)